MPETGQLIPLADAFGVTVDELLRGPKAPLTAAHSPDASAIQSEENDELLPTRSTSSAVTSEHTTPTAEATLPERSDPEKENAHAAQSDELEVYMKERRRRAKKKMTPLIILGAGISSIGLIVGFALLVAGFPELSMPFMFYGTPLGICIFGFAVAWICNYPKLKPGTTTKPPIKFLLALIAGFILSYGGTQLMFAWIEDWVGIIGSIVTGVGIIGIVYALLLWYNETKYCLIQEETQEKLSAGEPTKKKAPELEAFRPYLGGRRHLLHSDGYPRKPLEHWLGDHPHCSDRLRRIFRFRRLIPSDTKNPCEQSHGFFYRPMPIRAA